MYDRLLAGTIIGFEMIDRTDCLKITFLLLTPNLSPTRIFKKILPFSEGLKQVTIP